MKNEDPAKVKNSSRSLWVGVAVVFGLMAIAWTFLFTLASDNPVETVPLEHRQP